MHDSLPARIRHGAALLVLAASTLWMTPRVHGADVLDAVLQLRSEIPANARTANSLGTARTGSAILIDAGGLALTIGYLVLEATRVELVTSDGRETRAEIVAYDHDTGFGLVRALEPLEVQPIALGRSADVDKGAPVIVAGFGGEDVARPAFVVDRREFAGYWEYLLDAAMFTSPPYPRFSGAAMIGPDGKLIGVGSLQVSEATIHDGQSIAGNMFVPIDALKPILGDLITSGRGGGPQRPWLGLYMAEGNGRLFVQRVAAESPAAGAGMQAGDLVLGVGGQPVNDIASFYKAVWASGEAGSVVNLQVLQGSTPKSLALDSIDRYQWLRMEPRS